MKRTSFAALLALTLILCLALLLPVMAQKSQTTELPMEFRDSMTAVKVMVNGKGPFLFAIDTGAQGSARISAALVRQLGLKPSGQVRESDPSGRNSQMRDMFTLDSLRVGDLVFKNVNAAISLGVNPPRMPPARQAGGSPGLPPRDEAPPPRSRAERPEVDGILGFDLFADYLLTLNYPARKIIIEHGALPAANDRDILNFDNAHGAATIEITVGNRKIKADLDSGNMVGGFILPAAVVEQAERASEPAVVGRARSVSGEIEIKQVRLKDSIRWGEFEFKEPTVNYPSLADGNIGSQILKDFILTFDQKNRRVKFGK